MPIAASIDRLPAALAPMMARRRWLVWRWETNAQGKLTKVPYNAMRPASKAASDDPATWCDYETARDVALAGQADGIGYCVQGDEIAAFDLDDCVADDGTIATWAWNLIDECGSYVERTISGNGLRILGIGAGDRIQRSQRVPGTSSKLETFRSCERYIVVTGIPLDGHDGELRNIDKPIDGWVARLDAENKAARQRARDDARAETQAEITNAFDEHAARASAGSTDLPYELDHLIRFGVEIGRRSEKFFHAVGWLKDRGLDPGEIERLLAKHPEGIAAKYIDRLRIEVDRAFDRAETKQSAGNGAFDEGMRAETRREPKSPVLIWYGEQPPEPPPMLVRDLLPQAQTAIIAGMYSAGKTFIAADLAACLMLGVPFAGSEVLRTGGVLWLAAEGANEIDARIKAAAAERAGRDVPASELPFARQAYDVPTLTAPEAKAELLRLVTEFKAGLKTRFEGVELVAIVIDTMGSAANFVDGNSSSEAQRVMRLLREINTLTGALIIVVDHFGKLVDTGVMGASAKAQSAEAILAVMSDKDIEGNHSNRRMAVNKLRGGPSGKVTPFRLRQATVGGFGGTTCVIDWQADGPAETKAPKPAKPLWTGSTKLLKSCIERMLIDHGSEQQPFGMQGPRVKAVPVEKVRTEFKRSYSAETAEAKQVAFKRAMAAAAEKNLIATYEIGASLQDWVWFMAISAD